MILGIDMGASSSKWALFSDGVSGGEVAASGVYASLSGHLYTPEARQHMAAGLAGIRAAIPGQPSAVVVGVTGLSTDFAPLMMEMLSSTFHLPQHAIHVTDDLHLAYAAHFPSGGGTLVYAGTGSMAYHRPVSNDGTAADEVVRAGGHGFLIDDAGGAFWQGRQGLKAVLREVDEGRGESLLASSIFGVIGSQHWPDIRAYVYGEGRAALARLAPAVYAAAVDGDPRAQDIQRRAGEELARLGGAVLKRTGNSQLALCGGSFNPLVKAAFHAHFAGRDVSFTPTVSPLLGALALA
ncbi:N-acetylglucosamine kinase [Deinococcus sp. AJ005]|uniref:N-acetylglucosamine kinase n=1 Tax=Deinococcus sp. AJ005 TaxID=2652443 RepID=UPI00125CA789|nr:BadF/BadG/BcrA/BcrD ATPase family protein [Deinococcus sp. AJ005]QFP78060.1 ATPase [Deinococcus sp. AJ005]